MLPKNCDTSGVFAVLVCRVINVCGFTIFLFYSSLCCADCLIVYRPH